MNRADSVEVAYPLFQAEGGGSTPTSALDLRVYEIPTRTARELNKRWHSMLPYTSLGNLKRCSRSVSFAAEYQDIWYAVGIWTDPVAANRMHNAKTAMELRRFAIAPSAPRLTASRMLRVMTILIKRKFPDVDRLLSYQATERHQGTIYKAAGWTPATKVKFRKWTDRKDSTRRPPQIESDKVRWERCI